MSGIGSAVSALLGALIGAGGAISAGVLLESYKRHRDQCSVASSIVGEINSIIQITITRKTVENLEHLATLQEIESDFPKIGYVFPDPKLDPIIEKNLDKVGLLPDDLPERVSMFYTHILGFRTALKIIFNNEMDNYPEARSNIIAGNIKIWHELLPIGLQLCDDLRNVSKQNWWLHNFILNFHKKISELRSSIARKLKGFQRFTPRPRA